MLSLFGWLCTVLMGVSLGVLGAGGSILTIPILVYLFGINASLATSYSLIIVAVTALVGTLLHYRAVNLKTSLSLALPAIVSVYVTRRFFVPWIPSVFMIGPVVVEKDSFILLVFVSIMLLSAVSMIRPSQTEPNQPPSIQHPAIKLGVILLESVVIGVITALVGAGGGFLIVPALVLINRLDIKVAIASSLFIIVIKSLTGFIGDIQSGVIINYGLASQLIGLAAAGMVIGVMISQYSDTDRLKHRFGYFIIGISVLIIMKEFFV